MLGYKIFNKLSLCLFVMTDIYHLTRYWDCESTGIANVLPLIYAPDDKRQKEQGTRTKRSIANAFPLISAPNYKRQ